MAKNILDRGKFLFFPDHDKFTSWTMAKFFFFTIANVFYGTWPKKNLDHSKFLDYGIFLFCIMAKFMHGPGQFLFVCHGKINSCVMANLLNSPFVFFFLLYSNMAKKINHGKLICTMSKKQSNPMHRNKSCHQIYTVKYDGHGKLFLARNIVLFVVIV